MALDHPGRVPMSLAAAHLSKRSRSSCQSCRDRKALFNRRGSVRADRDHTLCFECYRRERERQRAQRLVPAPAVSLLRASAGGPLGVHQLAHREAMLVHLTQQGISRDGRKTVASVPARQA
jgi:hypothetical protein